MVEGSQHRGWLIAKISHAQAFFDTITHQSQHPIIAGSARMDIADSWASTGHVPAILKKALAAGRFTGSDRVFS
tara:strand:+ start:246 stop:467 length:222 start_codon:yes stop_codon:yes gene_type:complete